MEAAGRRSQEGRIGNNKKKSEKMKGNITVSSDLKRGGLPATPSRPSLRPTMGGVHSMRTRGYLGGVVVEEIRKIPRPLFNLW